VLLAADDPVPDQPEEPPMRLQRKGRPAGVPTKETPPAEKSEPGKAPEERPLRGEKPQTDEPTAPAEPDVDEQELLNRLARNMRTSEDRLANKELGDRTSQVQRDVLEDLDRLINKMNQPPDGGESSDASSAAQSGQQKQGGQQTRSSGTKSSSRQSARARSQRRQNRQQLAGQRSQGNAEGQAEQQAGEDPQMAGNNPGRGGVTGREEANKIADIYKDIWGHLPETMRSEMNTYGRQEYMQKYADAIQQYYSTLAEKGRRKE
jgi:hypothetical protein